MSIRTAMAGTLVKHKLIDKYAVSQLMIVVDDLVEILRADARTDPDLAGLIARAINPYGINNDRHTPIFPTAHEILQNLSALKVVVVRDT